VCALVEIDRGKLTQPGSSGRHWALAEPRKQRGARCPLLKTTLRVSRPSPTRTRKHRRWAACAALARCISVVQNADDCPMNSPSAVNAFTVATAPNLIQRRANDCARGQTLAAAIARLGHDQGSLKERVCAPRQVGKRQRESIEDRGQGRRRRFPRRPRVLFVRKHNGWW
jgi:hypothetical protein